MQLLSYSHETFADLDDDWYNNHITVDLGYGSIDEYSFYGIGFIHTRPNVHVIEGNCVNFVHVYV